MPVSARRLPAWLLAIALLVLAALPGTAQDGRVLVIQGGGTPFSDPRVMRAVGAGADWVGAARASQVSFSAIEVRTRGASPYPVPRPRPEAAKALLAEAGVVERVGFVLIHPQELTAMARRVAVDLRELGLSPDLRTLDTDSIRAALDRLGDVDRPRLGAGYVVLYPLPAPGPVARPDLSVAIGGLEELAPDVIEATITLRNDGGAPAPDTRLILREGSGRLRDTVLEIGTLGPGVGGTRRFPIAVPRGLAGETLLIVAEIATERQLEEVTTANNLDRAQITLAPPPAVRRPDAAVEILSARDLGGGRIAVEVALANIGDAPVEGIALMLGEARNRVARGRWEFPLPRGERRVERVEVRLADGIQGGRLTLEASVAAMPERARDANPENNTDRAVLEIAVAPDPVPAPDIALRIASVTLTPALEAALQVELANLGDAPAEGVMLRLMESDNRIAATRALGTIGAGQSGTIPLVVQIPAGVEAVTLALTLTAEAEGDRDLANNTDRATLAVPPNEATPSLTLRWVEARYDAGSDTIRLTLEVVNESVGATPPSPVRLLGTPSTLGAVTQQTGGIAPQGGTARVAWRLTPEEALRGQTISFIAEMDGPRGGAPFRSAPEQVTIPAPEPPPAPPALALAPRAPTEGHDGRALDIAVVVRNAGEGPSEAARLSVRVNGRPLNRTWPVPPLEPGETLPVSETLTLDPALEADAEITFETAPVAAAAGPGHVARAAVIVPLAAAPFPWIAVGAAVLLGLLSLLGIRPLLWRRKPTVDDAEQPRRAAAATVRLVPKEGAARTEALWPDGTPRISVRIGLVPVPGALLQRVEPDP